jgi:hypothetical protein
MTGPVASPWCAIGTAATHEEPPPEKSGAGAPRYPRPNGTARRLSITDLPVSAQPNAGLPRRVAGRRFADLDLTVLYAVTVRPFDASALRRAVTASDTADVVLVEPYLAGTSNREVDEALLDLPDRVLGLGVGRAARLHGKYDGKAWCNALHCSAGGNNHARQRQLNKSSDGPESFG